MLWLTTIALALSLGVARGLFGIGEPEWNTLRATFGKNPFGKYSFDYLPRTVAEASDEGWGSMGGACDGGKWRGHRYVYRVENDDDTNYLDYSVILLFDKNGYIAGLQASVPGGGTYPPETLKPPFVEDGNRYTISAYFVNPSIICEPGRTEAQFEEQGTGTGLYLQETDNPLEATLIPMDESEVQANSDWTEGLCFKVAMGVHYWHKAGVDMDCGKSLPVFLMYNFGKLDSWGWALMTDMTSPRWEHPPDKVLGKFFQVVPDCIKQAKQRSTLHVYFNNPADNYCYPIKDYLMPEWLQKWLSINK